MSKEYTLAGHYVTQRRVSQEYWKRLLDFAEQEQP